jgi:hypothetical protein
MNVTLQIPDDIAKRLTAAGGDLSRVALEALATEEYTRGRLTKPEVQRLSSERLRTMRAWLLPCRSMP